MSNLIIGALEIFEDAVVMVVILSSWIPVIALVYLSWLPFIWLYEVLV